ncbi:MAG: endonuclease/exonuclease/phosphatase family protein [Elainellaceae cyanobacterium]
MTKLLLTLAILLTGIPLALLIGFYAWASSAAYPKSRYAEIVSYGGSSASSLRPAVDTFTVVTYNIGYLSGLTNNLAVPRTSELFADNLKTAIAALRPLDADIIALQEIDLGSHRSYNVQQASELASQLGLGNGAIAINWDKRYVPFPYWPPAAHFRGILSGQAILSHHPIRTHERIVLEKVAGKPFFYNGLYLDRLAQVAELEMQGRSLIVINVHLEAFDEPTRRRQTQAVKALVEQYVPQYPVLLLGDFNSMPPTAKQFDPTIRILLDMPEIQPAFPEEGLAERAIATFPANDPIAKLDYIFYTPATIEALEWQVVADAQQASDHLPIMMRFRWR